MSRTTRFIDQNIRRIRPKPFTLAMLQDIPGGQVGLLPASIQGKPLKVEFAPWDNSNPTPENPESVELFWNEVSVGIKSWSSRIEPDDFFIEVPALNLSQGRHEVDYQLILATGQTEPSDIRVLTIDLQAPALNNPSELLFPAEVLTAGVTKDYLAAYGDSVKVNVPFHKVAAPGDVIVGEWKNLSNGVSHSFRSQPLTEDDYEDRVQLTFSGDFFRDTVKDGQWQVTYRAEDRAGNSSPVSTPVPITIAVLRPPRVAPYPWVVEIGDTPAESGVLKALSALGGATVRIPEEAVYFDEDTVELQFGEPGSQGAISVPVSAQSRDVHIPKENIAAWMKKTLPVYYTIHLPDGSSVPSTPLTLTISEVDKYSYPVPQLAAPFSDPVSSGAIPGTGLPISQRKWAFISTDCLISISVEGIGVLDKHRVTAAQTEAGVVVTAPKSLMSGLPVNQRFIVQTEVSFDDGATWFSFVELRPMLKP
ncbi:hypothetical protein ACIF2S_01480 [Pseudomonas taetrolens]|uniref:hypothetical protein n=1 Tax=Pseudomonas taetrolens TaxID=47884 RepID=UPI0037CC4FD5